MSSEDLQPKVASTFKILCGNIWGLWWPFSRHKRRRFARVGDRIRQEGHDVVFLQEVWRNSRRIPIHPCVRTASLEGGDSGLAMGTPGVEVIRTSDHHFSTQQGLERIKRKGWMEAEMRGSGGHPMLLVNTHFQAQHHGFRSRRSQVLELLDHLEDQRLPILIGGDLNLHARYDGDRELEALFERHGFVDTFLEHGLLEPTFTHRNPYLILPRRDRLDRFYVREGEAGSLRMVEGRVLGPEIGTFSDHQFIEATFELSHPTTR